MARRNITILIATALAAVISSVLMSAASRTVLIPCTGDIDAVVNADPAATTTRFQLQACNYTASNTIVPRDGDEIAGVSATLLPRGPAYDPESLTV